MTKRIYITTAIPYVNAAPHLGHALEQVQGDCLARFYRAKGYDVFWSWGTDDNSLKNVQAADAEGVSVQELVDKYAEQFKELGKALDLTFNAFNRTSSNRHKEYAQAFWKAFNPKDIYKKKYRGLYCVGCETFYTKAEIVDGKCPDGHTNIDEVEEENYFFKLTNYSEYLEKLISTDKLKIVPQTRKNEVLSFIKQGLEDISISRSVERARGWGVPVPDDPSQVIYVWVEALMTYLTAFVDPKTGELDKEKCDKYWWNNNNKVHIIGKGIIRFHAVYGPAFLKSAIGDNEDFPLPSDEFVHGYITVEGQKISKSLGNVIDPFDLVKKFGVDPVRYYLLREIPAWGDGDFSENRFKEIYNGELANGLGNLVARVARLASDTSLSLPLKKNFTFKKAVSDNLKIYRFDQAMMAIWDDASMLDKRINEEKPWELEGTKLKKVIAPIAQEVREIAFNLSPFLPETSKTILDQFTGKISAQKPLFPRI